MVNRFNYAWVANSLIIACRGDMRDQLVSFPPWEIPNHFPEAYFLGDYDVPPTKPLLGHVEVTVTGPLAFDLRNLEDPEGWDWAIDDAELHPVAVDLGILDVGGQPRLVTFWYRGLKLFVFHLFYRPPTEQ